MVFLSGIDTLLQRARRHAAAGEWADALLILREQGDATRTHPELATMRADAELRTGHPREARQWLTTALPTIERSGDRAAHRKAVNQLGVAEIELGSLDEAERVFGRALELARADSDDLLIAHATNNMGAIANIRGHRDEALSLYQLAIPAYQRLGNVAGLAQSLHNMAITFRHLGQLERAGEYARRAIGYANECANGPLLALAWLERAELSLQSGDAALAEVGATRAVDQFARIPDPIRQADALRVVGAARLALGHVGEAEAALARALEMARAHGSRLVEGETLRVLAECLVTRGDLEGGRREIATAIGIFTELGADEQRGEALQWASPVWNNEWPNE
ncbi:MAG TPA: tetratricopeptide repeat protein [Gemmatimonadaceae bacterium]|nr:tetratricopeptide repeat protein [Gemmatimonadaceae bacterium]